jgi:hypothetical protein
MRKGYKPLTRSSSSGPVKGTLTYAQWYENQSSFFKKFAGASSAKSLADLNMPEMTIDDIFNRFKPITFSGRKNIESKFWVQSALSVLQLADVAIGETTYRKSVIGFTIASAGSGYELSLSRKGNTVILTSLVLEDKLQRAGIGTDLIKNLTAAVKSSDATKLQIDGLDNVYIWLRTGLTIPENAKKFNEEILRLSNDETIYAELERGRRLKDPVLYRKVMVAHEKKLKQIMSSMSLRLIVVL